MKIIVNLSHLILILLVFIFGSDVIASTSKPFLDEIVKKRELLAEQAEKGDPKAQYELAESYRNDQEVPDLKTSFFWYTKSAENGYAPAQLKVSVEYMLGGLVHHDNEKAVYWLKKSAEQDYVPAQGLLAEMHYLGKGVEKNYQLAFFWWNKVSYQGVAKAQHNLGTMYFEGKGIAQNFKLAYVWESLAAAQSHETALKNRDIIAKKLSSLQIVEAQEITKKIQNEINQKIENQSNEILGNTSPKKRLGSGTGFIITKDGFIVTCNHVIEGSSKVIIIVNGERYIAKIMRDDPINDLALLKIKGDFEAITFSREGVVKMGQEVFTIGYPNPDLQGINAKITKGTINSLTGFQDDVRLYQISVPVQPGNSGGALVDANGNVIGIIMAMLDAKTTFNISGSVPQNVNYAIKAIYAKGVMGSIPALSGELTSPLRNKKNVVERVKNSTVMVLSYY